MNRRAHLLGGLLACHHHYGLDGVIWGDAADKASAEAVQAMGLAPAPAAAAGPTVLVRSTPIDLSYRLRCPTPERLHFPLATETVLLDPPRVEVALLENATVENWMGFHLIRTDGGLVADGSSAYAPLLGAPFADPAAEQVVGELDELFVATSDIDPSNFCHFICDELSLLALAADCRRAMAVLVGQPGQRFQQELLAMAQELHGHRFHWLEPGQCLRVKRLFYVRRALHRHPLQRCSAWAMAFLRDLLALPGDLEAAEGSVLYLARRSRRRVLNEAELLERLQRHSPRLQVVESIGTLSVREQAQLISRHEQVIGPHGAAFTLLMFRQRAPIRAMELMAAGNGTPAFALISSRLGIDHSIVVGDEQVTDQGPNYPDMTVTVDQVLELMAQR